MTRSRIKKFGVDMIYVVPGTFLMAFSSIGVLVPNGLSSGGISGIVRIIQQYIDVNFAVLYYVGAMIVLLVCFILLGAREAKKILLMSVLYPSVMVLLEQFDITLLQQKDLILSSITYGVVMGIGCGLVFYRGYSSGGTDTIAKILKTKLLPHVGLSQILMVIDGGIIIASGFVYGTNIALYALISEVVFAKAADMVMYGFDTKIVQVEIISAYHDEIVQYILNEIGRGVSNVTITGEYTKQKRSKIITLCSPRESMLIKQFVAQADRGALISVLRVDTVWGTGIGFEPLDKQEDM